jgi:hypothetical protein
MTGLPAPQLTVAPTSALDAADKAAIVAVCTRAFAEDFSSLFDLVEDARHVLAHLDGRLVGHACWATRWLQPAGCPPCARPTWTPSIRRSVPVM